MNKEDFDNLNMVFAMARAMQVQQNSDENALITIIDLKRKLLAELAKVPKETVKKA